MWRSIAAFTIKFSKLRRWKRNYCWKKNSFSRYSDRNIQRCINFCLPIYTGSEKLFCRFTRMRITKSILDTNLKFAPLNALISTVLSYECITFVPELFLWILFSRNRICAMLLVTLNECTRIPHIIGRPATQSNANLSYYCGDCIQTKPPSPSNNVHKCTTYIYVFSCGYWIEV